MEKNRLLKLAENPNNIPGIYNYCDYWCERCAFTSRCLNFQSHAEDRATGADIHSENFWDRISENLEMTMELLKDKALELGIDIDSLDFEEPHRETGASNDPKTHDLTLRSLEYIGTVKEWFEKRESIFEDKHVELLTKHNLELPGSNPSDEITELKDCVDTIRWYQHQIHAKLTRALYSSESLNNSSVILDDSAGSAKVSLIGLDRSIAAWTIMTKHFQGETDSIIDVLIHLDQIRKITEKTFPGARNFVRPGFDTEMTD